MTLPADLTPIERQLVEGVSAREAFWSGRQDQVQAQLKRIAADKTEVAALIESRLGLSSGALAATHLVLEQPDGTLQVVERPHEVQDLETIGPAPAGSAAV